MKVLGIRTAPKQLRFALLDSDGTNIVFLNQNAEHIIKVPAGVTEVEDIIHWQKSEVDRILRQNQDIDCVFQTKPATDSTRSLPPIPRQCCH